MDTYKHLGVALDNKLEWTTNTGTGNHSYPVPSDCATPIQHTVREEKSTAVFIIQFWCFKHILTYRRGSQQEKNINSCNFTLNLHGTLYTITRSRSQIILTKVLWRLRFKLYSDAFCQLSTQLETYQVFLCCNKFCQCLGCSSLSWIFISLPSLEKMLYMMTWLKSHSDLSAWLCSCVSWSDSE